MFIMLTIFRHISQDYQLHEIFQIPRNTYFTPITHSNKLDQYHMIFLKYKVMFNKRQNCILLAQVCTKMTAVKSNI